MPGPHCVGAPPGGMIDRMIFLARFASLLRKLTKRFLRSNSRSEPKNYPIYHAARWGPHAVGTGHHFHHVILLRLMRYLLLLTLSVNGFFDVEAIGIAII